MRLLLILSMFTSSVFAAKFDIDTYSTSLEFAQVTQVVATQKSADNWCFDTSVRHNDQGWAHYADGWEVIDFEGNQLGYRRLGHPHDNEQPFTRSQCNIKISSGITKVIVRAKCNKHGFGGKPIVVDLNIANTASGNKPLYKIVKDFESAITTKDRSKFFSLFYEGTISWVGVSSTNDFNKNKSRADTARAKGERVTDPMKTYPGDHVHFFDSIIAPTKAAKIMFENVKIQHDGDVASVYFDYIHYVGEVKSNWGKKSLLLVNTQSGWKINSVIFSISSIADKS